MKKREYRNRETMVPGNMLRLLPIQFLLAAIGTLNSIINSLFAGNLIGTGAMSAIGLYMPVNMLVSAISTMLVGGATILAGRYMGENAQDRMNGTLSLDPTISVMAGAAAGFILAAAALLDLTAFL